MFLKRNNFIRIMRNNTWFLFSPFLLLYLIFIFAFAKSEFTGDESRYIRFANHLLNGYYSPPAPDINLWNGPGYPLFLAPFIFLKFPLIMLRLLNGVLLYFSLIINYKTLSIYSSKRSAILFTMILGLYYPIYIGLPFILTEILTWFLISLICFLFVKNYQHKKQSWKLTLITASLIACLAMTRIIFGYVILSMMVVSVIICFLPKFHHSAKKSFLIFVLSFVFCLPYLIYTYNLTDKLFYWGNSGNMSLYTMSTPYIGETGQWYEQDSLLKNTNHKVFIDSISKLTPLERDDAYKIVAIKNIINHPQKYLTNIIYNIGRLLFVPSDYVSKSILSYYPFIPNMFIVVFIFLAIGISIIQYKRIPQELIFLLIFVLIYLMGSCLVSAYRRMFYITMPFWILFISYVFTNVISIKFKQID